MGGGVEGERGKGCVGNRRQMGWEKGIGLMMGEGWKEKEGRAVWEIGGGWVGKRG